MLATWLACLSIWNAESKARLYNVSTSLFVLSVWRACPPALLSSPVGSGTLSPKAAHAPLTVVCIRLLYAVTAASRSPRNLSRQSKQDRGGVDASATAYSYLLLFFRFGGQARLRCPCLLLGQESHLRGGACHANGRLLKVAVCCSGEHCSPRGLCAYRSGTWRSMIVLACGLGLDRILMSTGHQFNTDPHLWCATAR